MRKTLLAVVAATLGAVAVPAQAVSVDMTGYFRSGFGTSGKGGDQVCFGLPGVHKYRLGNECDNYGEFLLNAEIGKLAEGGPKFNYTLGLQYPGTSGKADVNDPVKMFNNFVNITGLGIGSDNKASIWAGRRNYNRDDVHMVDNTYWGQQGMGAGIEGVDLGLGKLAVAVFRTPAADNLNGYGVTGSTLDLRLTDIDVNPGGKLDAGLDLRSASKSSGLETNAKNGGVVTLRHRQELAGGSNTTVLQFGNGAGAGGNFAAGTFTHTNIDQKSYRFILNPTMDVAPNLSVSGLFWYQRDTEVGVAGGTAGSRNWMSLGARAMYQWADYFASGVEFGYDRASYKNATGTAAGLEGKAAMLTKLTIAPLVVRPAVGFFSRPELRLFATFAKWNDAANTAAGGNLTGNASYAGKTSATTMGVQLEAWF